MNKDKELQPVQISPEGEVMGRVEIDFSKDLETWRCLEKMSEGMGKPIGEVARIALERALERSDAPKELPPGGLLPQ